MRSAASVPLQAVLELHYFEDLSRSEMATLLEIPGGTVASRLRKAKEALREALESIAAEPRLRASTVTKLDDWLDAFHDGTSKILATTRYQHHMTSLDPVVLARIEEIDDVRRPAEALGRRGKEVRIRDAEDREQEGAFRMLVARKYRRDGHGGGGPALGHRPPVQ